MIRIEHINISFTERLIKDSSIQIDVGKVTAIKGKSGIGKTSLLYQIGLLDKLDNRTKYYFGNHLLNSHDQKKWAYIRRHHIGYVFQDSNILQHLNIYENFQYSFSLCHKSCSKTIIQYLLNLVDLNDISLNRMPSTLSGGEKQRLAIALALCKDPDIIILDEPTSALDHGHANQLMIILKRIAVNNKKMVLISTHSDDVLSLCDVIYEIHNQQIELVKGQQNESLRELYNLDKQKIHSRFYIDYVIRYFKYYRTTYLLLVLICGLGVTLLTLANPIENCFINYQNEIFNQNFNPEIFIVNYTDDTAVYYMDALPSLTSTVLNQIKKLDGVESIYPYREFSLTEVMLDNIPVSGLFLVQPYDSENSYEAKLSHHFLKYGEATSLEIEIDGKKVHLDVTSYYDVTEGNPYSMNNGWIIRVPYQLLFEQNENFQSSYVILCHDYTKIKSLYHQIKEIDGNIGVRYNRRQVDTYSDSIEDVKKTLFSIKIVLFGIVSISTIWIYSKHIRNRKMEFCLLRANGLSKSNLLILMMTEIGMIIFLNLLVALIICFLFSTVIIGILDLRISFDLLQFFLEIGICSFLLLFIGMAFSGKSIFSSRISALLRNN